VLGSSNTVNAGSAIAIGNANTVTGGNGIAIGTGVQVAGVNGIAIGKNANAGHAGSAAFGAGATTTRDNQQVFGTAGNTYTMSGIASAASAAAQSGQVQVVTSDASGNLATSSLAGLGLASSADINAINGQLAGINARLDDLTNRSNKAYTGVAMAFAMAGVPTLLPNESFAVTMNWGNFQSVNGLALNAAVRLSTNVQLNGGVGYGPNESLVGGRVGVRVGW
jgi:hypothetical protein